MPRWLDSEITPLGPAGVATPVALAQWHPRHALLAAVCPSLPKPSIVLLSTTGEQIASVPLPPSGGGSAVPGSLTSEPVRPDVATAGIEPGDGSLTTTAVTTGSTPARPTTFAWHPTRRGFAFGHASGSLLIWLDNKTHTLKSAHRAAIVAVGWIGTAAGGAPKPTPASSKAAPDLRLATADADGAVLVWQIDGNSANCTRLCEYKVGSAGDVVGIFPFAVPTAPSTAAAATAAEKSSGKQKSKGGSPEAPARFLVSTTSQLMVLSTDPAHASDAPIYTVPAMTRIARILVPTPKPISSAASPPFYASSSSSSAASKDASGKDDPVPTATIIMLCENGHLACLSVTVDLRIASMDQVKVGVGALASTAGNKVPWSLAWIAHGVIAVCNGGGVVRIVDFAGEESTTLEIDDTEDARIRCISFDAPRNRLAAGTDSGHVVIWQARQTTASTTPTSLTSIVQTSEPNRVWQQLPKTSLSATIEHLAFHSLLPLLLAIRLGQLRVLSEHTIVAAAGSDAVVLQTGVDKVNVVPFDSPLTNTNNITNASMISVAHDSAVAVTLLLPSSLKLHGLALSLRHVAAWSQQRAVVLHRKDKTVVAEFAHAAETMFLADLSASATSLNAQQQQEQQSSTTSAATGPILVQVTTAHVLVCSLSGKSTHAAIPVFAGGESAVTTSDETGCACISPDGGSFVAVVTKSGLLTVVDIVAGKAVVHARDIASQIRKSGADMQGDWIGVTHCAISSTGMHVATGGQIGNSGFMAVWAREMDSVSVHRLQTSRLAFDVVDSRYLVAECPASANEIEIKTLDDGQEAYTVRSFLVDAGEVFSLSPQPIPGRILAVKLPIVVFMSPTSNERAGASASTAVDADSGKLVDTALLADFSDLVASQAQPAAATPFSGGALATTGGLRHSNSMLTATAPPIAPSSPGGGISAGPPTLNRKLVEGMLDFRLALARGRTDLAFKLMPVRTSRTIWHALAAMCVKSRQLDAVVQCFGHAGNVRAARLVREARARAEDECGGSNASSSGGGGMVMASPIGGGGLTLPASSVAALGVAAEMLGMTADADRLYTEHGRWDLLARAQARRGDTRGAIQTAKAHDRLGLGRAYFDHAGLLMQTSIPSSSSPSSSSASSPSTAVADPAVMHALEKCDASGTAIPRYLLSTAPEQLGPQLSSSTVPAHARWLAQYAEAQGQHAAAVDYYARAGDLHAAVRMHCDADNLRAAREAAERSPAAAYHLAQHYETASKVKDAVAWYARARCPAHALRLAKDYELADDAMAVAVRCENLEVVLDAARWFEGRAAADSARGPVPQSSASVSASTRATTASRRKTSISTGPPGSVPTNMERAIRLYVRAGHPGKALDLAFDDQQYELVLEVVNVIATKMSNSSSSNSTEADRAVLARSAEFMMVHKQHAKAVELYLLGGDADRALTLCVENNIAITEQWCDRAFPPSGTAPATTTWAKVADACMQQGNYDLASKKYVQAGDKLGAVKALVKAGNVEQVIFFAGVSGAKNRDIYIVAANFLQTRDWRAEPAILKHIVTFYTKAKAFDHLSSFFETCAQIEVDEYSSYEKALGALKEAYKCTTKSMQPTKEARMLLLDRKMEFMTKFVSAQQAAKQSVEQTLQICAALLNDPDVEIAVRVGDVYALLVETYLAHNLATQARDIYTRMLGTVPIRLIPYYLDPNALQIVDPGFKDRSGSGATAGAGATKRPVTAGGHAAEVDEEEELVTEASSPSSSNRQVAGV
ncbi:hypothetical protein BC828DRAFT_404419 [Blastocladiella britannica]|nr:hypothetical protein BC828DRAFT_404419 [Blastocladiella britannica]